MVKYGDRVTSKLYPEYGEGIVIANPRWCFGLRVTVNWATGHIISMWVEDLEVIQ